MTMMLSSMSAVVLCLALSGVAAQPAAADEVDHRPALSATDRADNPADQAPQCGIPKSEAAGLVQRLAATQDGCSGDLCGCSEGAQECRDECQVICEGNLTCTRICVGGCNRAVRDCSICCCCIWPYCPDRCG